MNSKKLESLNSIKGTLAFEGDKSISHRAVMFGSLAKGKSVVQNLSASYDVQSTIKAFRALGATIEQVGNQLTIDGCGFNGFKQPTQPLDSEIQELRPGSWQAY